MNQRYCRLSNGRMVGQVHQALGKKKALPDHLSGCQQLGSSNGCERCLPWIVERSAEIAPLRQSHGTDLVALSLPCAAPATIDLAVRRLVSPIKIESTIHKDSDYHCLQLIKQKAENQKWKELSFSIVGRPSPLSQQQSDHG